MEAGSPVIVIKLDPDGHEAARYVAAAVDESCPDGWFALDATWLNQPVSPHGLSFETGDTLIEYFSPDEWFNVFRVQSPEGNVRGWYANVTCPPAISLDDVATVTWHDLYLDVIRFADGRVILCDENELEDSGLPLRNPELRVRIVETAEQLLAMAKAGSFPFHEPGSSP